MILRRTPARVGAYAGVLAVAFGVAFAVGAAAGPDTSESARERAAAGRDGAVPGRDSHDARPAATLPGLSITKDGYTIAPAAATLPAGGQVPFRFVVTGPDGEVVRSYRTEHDKELHLIVVRHDLAGFQHLHPTRSADGTWSARLNVATGGTYRAFADFTPAALGQGLTLGTDIAVGGRYRPTPLPAAADTTTVGGYDVVLGGTPVAGGESRLTFTVSRDASEVRELQPYLGAFGHLVSLRTGDLAYLHTHPSAGARAGARGAPKVRFTTEFPTPGTYRLFLDFKHAGGVRTAAFTVTVGTAGSASHDDGGAHGHS